MEEKKSLPLKPYSKEYGFEEAVVVIQKDGSPAFVQKENQSKSFGI